MAAQFFPIYAFTALKWGAKYQYLPRAVANSDDLEAKKAVAYGSTIAGISKAFAKFFIEKHACDEQFIKT